MKRMVLSGVIALIASVGSAQAEPLALATGNDYKPFSDQTLPHGGFMTEVVAAALDAADLTYEVSWLPWKRG